MRTRTVLLGFMLGTVLILMVFGMVVLVVTTVPESSRISFSSNAVGVIDVFDVITDSRRVLEELADYRDDSSVRAIVVRIDSPGGAVGPSQEIYSEIVRTRQTKTVVASLGGMAASGGYYIACGADMIVANPGTLTGSIGAIMEFMNLEEVYRWARVENDVVKSGRYKDMGSTNRPLTSEERALLQEMVDDVLGQFVEAIALGRNLSADQVRAIADGRIFTGAQAQKLGLVDRLGNFNDAVMAAAEISGIDGRPRILRVKPKSVDILDLLLDSMASRFWQSMEKARVRAARPWNLQS
ncbi:MAG: signal peptide peptidase SppA [Deltaproteobacteria bacterium]|nr:signal peptide peptidase SppA [Deltaproteobacteria bacterium]